MSAVSAAPEPPARRLSASKREAILLGARSVFSRMGFSRASTQGIAAEANVSTRTLYNHFASKDELFRAVLIEGAAQVADAFSADVAGVDASAGPELALLAIGRALAAHRIDFPEHFALTQQLAVEREHVPSGLLDEFRRAGPERVEHEVARLITTLTDAGALARGDAVETAFDLILLTAGAIAFRAPPGTHIPAAAVDAIVTRGVQTFLHGHAAR